MGNRQAAITVYHNLVPNSIVSITKSRQFVWANKRSQVCLTNSPQTPLMEAAKSRTISFTTP